MNQFLIVINNISKSFFSFFNQCVRKLRGGGAVTQSIEMIPEPEPQPNEPFSYEVFMTRLKNASRTVGAGYLLYTLAGCVGVVLFLLMPIIVSIGIGVAIALGINWLINQMVDMLTGRRGRS